MPSFLITNGRGATRRFETGASKITIGRGDHNDIVVPEAKVSWDHGYFTINGSDVSYVDRSRNGSYVNGELINNTGRRLSGGDVVEFWGEEIQLLGDEGRVEHPATEIYRPPRPSSPEESNRPPAERIRIAEPYKERHAAPAQEINQQFNVNTPSPALYKSYVGWSFLILLLYFIPIISIVALIMNIIFLSEAANIKRASGGVSPSGYGCLQALLIWVVGSFVLTVLVFIFFWGSILALF